MEILKKYISQYAVTRIEFPINPQFNKKMNLRNNIKLYLSIFISTVDNKNAKYLHGNRRIPYKEARQEAQRW